MFKIAFRQVQWTVLKPEFVISILVGTMGYVFDLVQYVKFSLYIGAPLNILEPFIASSSNYVTVTISVFSLLFLLSDIPFSAADDNYVLLRISRRKWLCGKIIYIVSSCAVYYFAIAVLTIIAAIPFSFLDNIWSEPIEIMCFNDPFLSVNLFGVSYYAPNVVSALPPVEAAFASYTLITLYSITLCMILLVLKILLRHQYVCLSIVYIIHALGYLPMLVVVGYRRFSMFASALLSYHDFNNEAAIENIQSLNESYIMFLVEIVIAIIISIALISARRLYKGGQDG